MTLVTRPVTSLPTPARAAPLPAAGTAQPLSGVNPVVRLAFYLFVFSIPFELPDARSIPVEIPTATGALLLLATMLNPSAAFRRIPGAVWCFTIYLWMFGAAFLANGGLHTDPAIEMFLILLQGVLLMWVGSNLLRDPRVLRGMLLTLAAACALRAGLQLLGIGATSYHVWTGGERVTAFGQNANIAAMILAAGVVTLLNLRPRLLTWPLAGVVAAAIIQTGSRGGLACVLVGVLAMLWQGSTRAARVRNALVGLVAVVLLIVGALRSEMLRHRMEQAAEGGLAGRERIYPALLEMISERPLLGWGPIENQVEIAARIGELEKDRRDAHNLVLELLSTTGIAGTVPFLLGLLLVFRSAWRARRGALGLVPLAVLMAVSTGTISGTWIAAKILWLAFALALAAGALASRDDYVRHRWTV